MEFPKKSCPAGRKRVTLGRFRNAILKEKLQMNMKNIIKNKQKELVQGMIALILCVALFCSAAVSGKNDGSEWKMRHGGQKYEETGTDGRVQTPLYAQEFLQNFARMRWQFCRTTRRFLRKQQSVQRRSGTSGTGRLHIFTGTEVLDRGTGMVGGVVEPVCQRQLLRQFRMRSVLYGKYLLHAYGVYLFSVGHV